MHVKFTTNLPHGVSRPVLKELGIIRHVGKGTGHCQTCR